jgi:hypothetical protein
VKQAGAKPYCVYNIVFFYRDFDDQHMNSIDGLYRSAGLQLEIVPVSHVFSLPFDAGNQSIIIVKISLFR